MIFCLEIPDSTLLLFSTQKLSVIKCFSNKPFTITGMRFDITDLSLSNKFVSRYKENDTVSL